MMVGEANETVVERRAPSWSGWCDATLRAKPTRLNHTGALHTYVMEMLSQDWEPLDWVVWDGSLYLQAMVNREGS